MTLTPIADAYVSSSSPNGSHGTGYELDVDGSPDKIAYFTFDLSSLGGTVMSAQFTINSSWDGTVDGGNIQDVSDTSWTESALTYTNRPALSGVNIASLGPVAPYASATADVTSGVSGNGLLGLAITSTSNDGVAYDARESPQPPTLTVTVGVFDGTPTPTPSPTNTPTQTATSTSTSTPTNTPTNTPLRRPQRRPATPTGDPIVAVAGDIACDPTSPNYNNGNGTADRCQQLATSDLLIGQPLTAVLVLGDNQYDEGTLAQYNGSYDYRGDRVKRHHESHSRKPRISNGECALATTPTSARPRVIRPRAITPTTSVLGTSWH